MKSTLQSDRAELTRIVLYILGWAILAWWPLVYFLGDWTNPLLMFADLRAIGAAVMFFSGAVIANATSVGGGMVFNPTLQFAFGVTGYSALTLSILAQCAGMSSGTYGWYRRGEFRSIRTAHLWRMIATTVGFTAFWSVVFLLCRPLFPEVLSVAMKIASAGISIYVFFVVYAQIKQRESVIDRLERDLEEGNVAAALKDAEILVRTDHPRDVDPTDPLRVDARIYPWLVLGSLLNVYTAVGAGELLFSHLIKYYRAPPKAAVAAGTLIQAVSVCTQALFFLVYMRQWIIPEFVFIGLLMCLAGGRVAPFLLTRRLVEPFAKHILAFTALSMGIISALMAAPELAKLLGS